METVQDALTVPSMTDADKPLHDFKNHLSVIHGFSEMLLANAAHDDPRRSDVEEIHKAATAPLHLLERLFPACRTRRDHGRLRRPPASRAQHPFDADDTR